MNAAIFLSASVPDPRRAPHFAATADSVAITAAVSALVFVTLGRRSLVWGGHPAITPMIVEVAASMDIDYGRWITLYQSKFFKDDFPEENMNFQNIVLTSDINSDREKSLFELRMRMFSDHKFDAAVFIGGMQGIIDELKLFRDLQPRAAIVPIVSTGGAVATFVTNGLEISDDLSHDFDYVALLHRHLKIDPRERRYNRPTEQPREHSRRIWKFEDFKKPPN